MKNKLQISLLVISLFSALMTAQDLDESFLKSLPDDIAKDLLDRSSAKSSMEEMQYRRPSTFIEKPDPTSDRFGAQIFSMMQSSLMPINEPNFDPLYILDFGDQLQLQLTGQESSITIHNIKRDGSINIEDIGKIFLAGLSLNEAANMIKSKINESFIGVDSYLTLVNVRDIQIIMAGNVYNPGSYVLNGNSNIFHALSVAGGPSELGSFRSIDLVRNNKKIESIDLYNTFINGKSSFDTRLRSGDLIFVNPLSNEVSIAGAIKRPGRYELLEDEYLYNVIKFANGISKNSDLSNIKLERILDGDVKTIPITNVSQFKNIKSKDGDRIFIRSHPFRNILVEGAVLNPGSYLMSSGDNLLDAIEKAGGYTENAYPFGAVYENLVTLEINTKANQELYKEFLDNILLVGSNSNSENDISAFVELIELMQNSPVSGRVITDLLNQDDTPFVRDGDILRIPEFFNTIYVFGEVSSEGTVNFKEGESTSYYIDLKGGFKTGADKDAMFILHPNGETERIKYNKNVFMTQAKENSIYPGSIIYVPTKFNDDQYRLLRSQAYVSILSSLGVSLASLSVLRD